MSKLKKFKDFFPIIKAIDDINDIGQSTSINMDDLDDDYKKVKEIIKNKKDHGIIILDKKNKIKLPSELISKLNTLPESGMGYQVVDIKLKDGKILSNRKVINSEYLMILDKENIKTSDIFDVNISMKKNESSSNSNKPSKRYYNKDVNFIPYTKSELDSMSEDELSKEIESFITKTNWYEASKSNINDDLNLYTCELSNYRDLRFPKLDINFTKWSNSEDEAAKFITGLGIDRIRDLNKTSLIEKIKDHKFITGLSWEEYNK